ncbi:spore protease YyaC [Bacillus sp. NPDC077027]|uniref:spore protease YyaC n=1 Tax=Bacillus sp. NPDC077027 TaxID=3390548 RepID=UPI003CFD7059
MNSKNGLFFRNRVKEYVSHTDTNAIQQIKTILISHLEKSGKKPIVIVCIGTDRSTGDSLGPLVGTKLSQLEMKRLHVYGTLSDPVHAVNLKEKLAEIEQEHKRPFIIAVDACLGRVKSVGSFQIGDGPLKPGAGVQKELPEVGDIHINGIVNVSGFMEYFVLQNTRLHLVMSMANTLSESLYEIDQTDLTTEKNRFIFPSIQNMTGRI